MRLLLASMICPKGQLAGNRTAHFDVLRAGAAAGCDLVLLPEMSLTGYCPAAAISLDHPAVTDLVAATSAAPALCFGLGETSAHGAQPCITQVVAAEGRLIAVHRKAHLGDGEDDDFLPGQPAGVFRIAGVSCALAICAEIGTPEPYRLGSELILAPAAPGLYGDRRVSDAQWRSGFDWWRHRVIDDARRFLSANQQLAVSTQAGATDDEDFPGWAALLGAGGDVVAELSDWRPTTLLC
jgi:NAD+ synthase (glutamine-hydrolysing)